MNVPSLPPRERGKSLRCVTRTESTWETETSRGHPRALLHSKPRMASSLRQNAGRGGLAGEPCSGGHRNLITERKGLVLGKWVDGVCKSAKDTTWYLIP